MSWSKNWENDTEEIEADPIEEEKEADTEADAEEDAEQEMEPEAEEEQELCLCSQGDCCSDGCTFDVQGTSCGDTGNDCVIQDTCNGSGACTDNGFKSPGFVCGTEDQCNGSGSCVDCFDVNGCTDLSDPSRDEACTTIICGANSVCQFNDTIDGEICGPEVGECEERDTCNGSGVCTDNGFKLPGFVCGTEDQCNGSGSCVDCVDMDGCVDLDTTGRDTECFETLCEETVCTIHDVQAMTECGDTEDDCTNQDICSGNGTCLDNGFADEGTPCETDDQCDGLGSCIDCVTADACSDMDLGDKDSECVAFSCTNGSCFVTNLGMGTQCLIDGEGVLDQCDGEGNCVDCIDTEGCNDFSIEPGECLEVACESNTCQSTGQSGASCDDGIDCTVTECQSGSCEVIGTTTGCFIDDTCYGEGDHIPEEGSQSCYMCSSGCWFCSQADNWENWTYLGEGASCVPSNPCMVNATCQYGKFCEGLANSCNGHGSCWQHIGECECDNPYMNEDCSDCIDGYTGYPDCQLDFNFVEIPAGTFWMGTPGNRHRGGFDDPPIEEVSCPDGYPGHLDGQPGVCMEELFRAGSEDLHYVQLTYPFEMASYEVTQGLFKSVMGGNPGSIGNLCDPDRYPVNIVSWYDAVAFANEYSRLKGLPECYVLSNAKCWYRDGSGTYDVSNYLDCYKGRDTKDDALVYLNVQLANGYAKPQECEGYRLPTEAEWEYAARSTDEYTALYTSAGNDGTLTSTDDPNLDLIAWYSEHKCCSDMTTDGCACTHIVGELPPNRGGLYDMLGNASEMVWDLYLSYPEGTLGSPAIDPVNNPLPTLVDISRDIVLRGGSFGSHAYYCRLGSRSGWSIGSHGFAGFRIVRTLHDQIVDGDAD